MSKALTAVDLFAGAGGTTQGLRDAGFRVIAAIENDEVAAASYACNHPETGVIVRDIRRVQAPALSRQLARDTSGLGHQRLDLLTACPPCQGFSTLGLGDSNDKRNDLLASVARFTAHLLPRAILVENVPGLALDRRVRLLSRALAERYDVQQYIVDASEFGVPQRRRRVIIVAVDRDEGAVLPADLGAALPDGFERGPFAAGPAIAAAGPIEESADPVHRSRRSTAKTLERMRHVPPGGGRLDLPEHLRLACHDRLGSRSATSIYGRIDPAAPAPTMTTRCTTPSCGRFVHPFEDRGISLREAALLQTFPLTYEFSGSYGEIERQIGNAVPPRLAQALGLVVSGLLTRRASAAAVGA